MDLETIRSYFPITSRYIYFNHAALSPLPKGIEEVALNYCLDRLQSGGLEEDKWFAKHETVRSQAAQLIGAKTSEIAFMSSTTDGLSAVANGYPWSEGDNIITCDLEFPANVYPWLNLRSKGVELRIISCPEGRVKVDDLVSAMDPRTKILALSMVEFNNGFRNDLESLSQLCAERKVHLVLDAIQGLGALKLDVSKLNISALSSGCHKWLLSPQGIALLYVREDFLPILNMPVAGWLGVKNAWDFRNYELTFVEDATRYEGATPNHIGILSFGVALDLFLQAGTDYIEKRILELTDHLCEGLESAQAEIVSSREPKEKSGIVAFKPKYQSSEELCEVLEKKGIIVCVREGNIRVSPHFYNTSEEIDTMLKFF